MSRPPAPIVCVALDVGDLASASAILDDLDGAVGVFKVGLELFSAEGPGAVEEVRARGADVFLDLKVNDIPKQAAGAVRSAARMGVAYLTVHGNGGRAMLRAATEAAEGGPTRILVVSVLTSLDDGELRETGCRRSVGEQVAAMASLAAEERAGGLVLGGGEVASVRREHPDLFLVTPGIRPAGTVTGDQRRVGTPASVVEAGVDLLVVGRAVTDAPRPRDALDAVLEEIEGARGRRERISRTQA